MHKEHLNDVSCIFWRLTNSFKIIHHSPQSHWRIEDFSHDVGAAEFGGISQTTLNRGGDWGDGFLRFLGSDSSAGSGCATAGGGFGFPDLA